MKIIERQHSRSLSSATCTVRAHFYTHTQLIPYYEIVHKETFLSIRINALSLANIAMNNWPHSIDLNRDFDTKTLRPEAWNLSKCEHPEMNDVWWRKILAYSFQKEMFSICSYLRKKPFFYGIKCFDQLSDFCTAKKEKLSWVENIPFCPFCISGVLRDGRRV